MTNNFENNEFKQGEFTVSGNQENGSLISTTGNGDANLTVSQHSFFQKKMQKIKEEKELREANRRVGSFNLIESAFPKLVVDTEDTGFKFPITEIINAQAETVYAVRGVLLYFGHGLRLFDGSASKMVCKTVAAVEQDELGNEVLIRSDLPMYAPIPRLEKYGETNEPHPALVSAKTKGMRGKSCADCVRAGEHIIETASGAARCSQVGYQVFFVTEVLVPQREKKLVGGTRRILTEYKWEKLTEWLDKEGDKLFEKPITVAIKLGAKSSAFKVYFINRKDGTSLSSALHTTSYAGPASSVLSKAHTPADVMPWGEFLETVIASNWQMCEPFPCKEGGTDYSTHVFKAVVEVYATKPILMENNEDITPPKLTTVHAYRLTNVDKEYLEQAVALAKEQYAEYLRNAHQMREKAGEGLDKIYPAAEDEFFESNALPGDDIASRAHASMQARLKK